jgi:hypothetical protein
MLHKDYDRKGSVKKKSNRKFQGACRQDDLIGRKPLVVKWLWLWLWVVESVESCSCEKWEAGKWGRGQFGNTEEAERPPLESATKQRLVKTETLCVLQLQWYL